MSESLVLSIVEWENTFSNAFHEAYTFCYSHWMPDYEIRFRHIYVYWFWYILDANMRQRATLQNLEKLKSWMVIKCDLQSNDSRLWNVRNSWVRSCENAAFLYFTSVKSLMSSLNQCKTNCKDLNVIAILWLNLVKHWESQTVSTWNVASNNLMVFYLKWPKGETGSLFNQGIFVPSI